MCHTCGTPAKRADLRARLSEIDYVLSPGGFRIYSGTPHSYYSIYAKEARPEEDGGQPFLPEFERLEEPLTEHVWPERYPPQEIEAIRRHAGPARFASQMLLEPVQSLEGRLNAIWLRRYEGRLEYSEAGGRPVLMLEGRRLVSASGWWDPAYGKENKGDANVLAAEARALFLPIVYVESNGVGRFLPDILKRALDREGHGASVVERHNHRPKRERILEAFDAPLAAGVLSAHASVFATPFLRELREWRPEANGPDDGLDAAAGALLAEPARLMPRSPAPRNDWRRNARPGRARTGFRI